MEQDVINALQAQFNHERTNAQKYYYLADCMENLAYDGFAKFFKAQADGEMEHARMISGYLISKRIKPEYAQVVGTGASSSLGVLQLATFAYETELGTTEALKEVYRVADEAGDFQVCAFIDTMLLEQIEEETVTADLVDQVKRVGADGLETLNQAYNK